MNQIELGPKTLRTIAAALAFQDPNANPATARTLTDNLLNELERTAKPEPPVSQGPLDRTLKMILGEGATEPARTCSEVDETAPVLATPPMPKWPSDGCTRAHPHEPQPGICDGNVFRSIEQHQRYTRDLEVWGNDLAIRLKESMHEVAMLRGGVSWWDQPTLAEARANGAREEHEQNTWLKHELETDRARWGTFIQHLAEALGVKPEGGKFDPQAAGYPEEAIQKAVAGLLKELSEAKRLLKDSLDMMEGRQIEEKGIREILEPVAEAMGVTQASEHSMSYLVKEVLDITAMGNTQGQALFLKSSHDPELMVRAFSVQDGHFTGATLKGRKSAFQAHAAEAALEERERIIALLLERGLAKENDESLRHHLEPKP